MPLLFGAFGNFLLPTQLGVHDVAFPRLNSVAFWFLPGGLIMLCQLVCLDRRYQRMNCFNIREIQTLLKARFYADLLHESSRHLFLSKTTINLRFKLQDLNFLNLNSLLINRYGIYTGLSNKTQTYSLGFEPTKLILSKNVFIGNQNLTYTSYTTPYFHILKVFNGELVTFKMFRNMLSPNGSVFTSWFNGLIPYFTTTLSLFNTSSYSNSFNNFSYFEAFVVQLKLFFQLVFGEKNLFYIVSNTLNFKISFLEFLYNLPTFSQNQTPSFLTYVTNNFLSDSLQTRYTLTHQEGSGEYRYQRLQNPIFRYDFKLGNYMPDENKKKNPFLYTTIHDLTTGVRKSPWYYSTDFFKFIKGDVSLYFLYHNNFMLNSAAAKIFNNNISDISSSHTNNDPFYTNITHSAGLYNYFFLLSEPSHFINNRWLGVNALNQKLYKMFLTNSMQQRIHAN
jgi:hypothetical protein